MFIKYPKTFHIEDYWEDSLGLKSLVQDAENLEGLVMVIEEKMDGTQVGISFDAEGNFKIQSRGSYISSESEFSLLKQWVGQNFSALFELLGNRYILFGEWLYAKHTMYYDLLPDYLLEFDIFDREREVFLSTSARKELFGTLNFLKSVRIIDTLDSPNLKELYSMIRKSAFISENAFKKISEEEIKQTDTTGLMEGLYLKIEDKSKVLSRYKLIRPEFIRTIVESGSHWKKRLLKINQLGKE